MKTTGLALCLLTSCATVPGDRSTAGRGGEMARLRATAERSHAAREELFVERVATDKNGALCAQVIERLHRDDIDALTPFIDRRALVERALRSVELPKPRAASWREHAETIDALSQFHFPKGTQFYCLGTFLVDEAKVLALRSRQPTGKFGYLLLHLSQNLERPFDDYQVLEGGFWHSELQVFFDVADRAPHRERHREMLMASFEGKHDQIIATYKALPESLQLTPVMFHHYVNAVMTVTTHGGEANDLEFQRALKRIDDVYSSAMARSYWRVIFLARLGDKERALAEVDVLTAPFADPLADELRWWVHQR